MPRYCNVNSSGVLHSKHAQAASPPCRRATLAGRTVGEIRHPQLIRTVSCEVSLHEVPRAGSCIIRYCGAHLFAPADALDTERPHQSLDCASGYRYTFSTQLLPDFPGTVDLEVSFPYVSNLHHQLFVALCAMAAKLWIAASGGVAPVR